MFAVGRETCEHLIAVGVVGDFVGDAALDVDGLKVTAIAEHHVVAVDSWKAQHSGFLLGSQADCAQ